MLRQSTIAPLVIAIVALSGCATQPSDLTPESTATLPRRVELADIPFFPQDQYQCGPAALATVLANAGIDVTPEVLTSEVYLPGKRGSLAVELIAATRSRGMLAYAIDPSLLAVLRELAAGRPVLVMQNLGAKIAPVWHFAVVAGYDLDAGTLLLRSGTTERLVMNQRKFLRTWKLAEHWAIVVLEPDQLPTSPNLERYVAAAAGLETIGRLRAAEQAYTQAQRHWPESVWPVLGLANVDLRKGDKQSAELGYRRVLTMDPDSVVANNNLAELLHARGCVDSARRYVQHAAMKAAGTSLEPAVAETARRIEEPTAENSRSCQ